MSIDPKVGLYREILTKPLSEPDEKFNTFSITDTGYKTYINVGLWTSVEAFDAAVGGFIQPPERRKPLAGPNKDREMLAVYREDFEFKVRERIVLTKVLDRGGPEVFGAADL